MRLQRILLDNREGGGSSSFASLRTQVVKIIGKTNGVQRVAIYYCDIPGVSESRHFKCHISRHTTPPLKLKKWYALCNNLQINFKVHVFFYFLQLETETPRFYTKVKNNDYLQSFEAKHA